MQETIGRLFTTSEKSKFRTIATDVTEFAPVPRKTVFEVYKNILVERKFAFLKVVRFVHGDNLGPYEKLNIKLTKK